MRLLVACPTCQRQYDASGRDPGSRFHCSCGELLTVGQPRGHDASVVRCSSCGAPREDDATSCRFCGSEYTLHERDLHTLCPGCLARISDRARYCHHCGLAILPQGSAGEGVEETCPVCGTDRHLVSRGLGGERVTVLECGGCAGMWVGKEIFQILETKARERSPALVGEGRARVPPLPGALQEGPLYRPCVVCGQLMQRRNYSRKSGVILDICHQHGLWFDAGELDHALRWVRDGGLAVAERTAAEQRREEERQDRFRKLTEVPPVAEQKARAAGTGWSVADVLIEIVGGVLETLFDL